MTKRYYLINTTTIEFRGDLAPGETPDRHLFLSAFQRPLTIERIDVSWKASKDHGANNWIVIDFRTLGDGPEDKLDPVTSQPLQIIESDPTGPSFEVSSGMGFGDALNGPWVFSPAPGASTYSVDFTPFGGLTFDSQASDINVLDLYWTTSDMTKTADDYRLAIVISEDV